MTPPEIAAAASSPRSRRRERTVSTSRLETVIDARSRLVAMSHRSRSAPRYTPIRRHGA